jgi:hypothetical protein
LVGNSDFGFRFLGLPESGIPLPKTEFRNFPAEKNRKFMAGIGSVIVKKKKKKAGTFFSDRNRKRNRKNRLKKTTGIRNSAEFRRNSGGIPNQAPVAAAAAATALLSLAAPLNARKHPLATISPNIPLAAGGGNGKTQKTAHMAKIER